MCTRLKISGQDGSSEEAMFSNRASSACDNLQQKLLHSSIKEHYTSLHTYLTFVTGSEVLKYSFYVDTTEMMTT